MSFKISRISTSDSRSSCFNPLTAQGEVWVRTLCMSEKWGGGLSIARRTKEGGKSLKLRFFEGRWANIETSRLMNSKTKLRLFLYCDRRTFRTRFNFVLFTLSAESTKCSSIRKPCKYNSVCDSALAVRKFTAYKSSRTLEYEIFTRAKISAITVSFFFVQSFSHLHHVLLGL